jgi:hypothetical protein
VARQRPSGRTTLLGGLAGSAVVTVFGAELVRVWRLGTLPRGRDESAAGPAARNRVSEALVTLRQGFSVSRSREDPFFNMLFGFTLSFASSRGITWWLRERGGVGPLRNVVVGDRHIHHFVPGGLIGLGAGAIGIGVKDFRYNNWLARWFGGGVALVLDESALLLELEDVYWTEEGLLGVQITLAVAAMLAALALGLRFLRRGEELTLEGVPGAAGGATARSNGRPPEPDAAGLADPPPGSTS